MAEITEQELLQSIREGFDKAFSETDQILNGKASNRGSGRLSSRFVYQVSSAIYERLDRRSPGLCLRVIEVDEFGKRTSGEWLVDACITEEKCDSKKLRFIDRIVFAMESESDTAQRAFNKDFAKLVHLKAKYKLYLNGLDHKTPNGMRNYTRRRCKYAEAVLNRIRPSGEFYLGFWPSPRKPDKSPDSVDSIWKRLQCGEWRHLNGIRLWRFDTCARKLIEVRPEGG
ncbi:MAG: hypothetical protein OXP09_00315 [Gammaproteobacteria bacterium]|nr:hypothetical protein [Gammaproteobacteria bacterium]MDE0363995.1 hypothetical protein [Gammaproteobacteria bacterium]